MTIWPKKIFVTSNFEIRQAIPDMLVDAIEARFTSYHFDKITGYKVRPRVENLASDRVLRVLQLYEPDIFSNGSVVQEETSTLSAEATAFGMPDMPEIPPDYDWNAMTPFEES